MTNNVHTTYNKTKTTENQIYNSKCKIGQPTAHI